MQHKPRRDPDTPRLEAENAVDIINIVKRVRALTERVAELEKALSELRADLEAEIAKGKKG